MASLLWPLQAVAQPAPQPSPATSGAAATPVAPGDSAAPAAGTARASEAQPLTSALAVSGGLRAVDAGRRAASTSVQAAIEKQQVIAAGARRSQIIWDVAPRLTLTGQATLLSEVDGIDFNPPGTPPGTGFPSIVVPNHSYLLNARLSVPLSDYAFRLARALRGAGANEEAEAFEERAARITAATNAKLAYYDWVRARLASVVSDQARAQAAAQLERMRALESVGRAAQADVLQAQAFEAESQLASTEAKMQEAIAEERLRISIHAEPGEQLQVGEDVLAPFAQGNEAATLDALQREARQHRLEFSALERAQSALDEARGVESSRALPRVDAVGNVTYANPNQRVFPLADEWNATWDVGVTATWSLNDIGTASASATIAGSQLGELLERRTALEESLRVEVLSALSALNQARAGITTAEQGERAAQAALEARERLQAQGLATALELVQAEIARTRARLAVINAHIGLRVARVQLDHAVGRDVAEMAAR